MTTPISVDSHFEDKAPEVKATYDRLLAVLRLFGPVREVPRKTSIHLEKTSGFAGIHPRKKFFNLEFRTNYKISDPRIVKRQRLATRHYEYTVKMQCANDVDDQLLNWLRDAYDLCG